MPKHPWTPNAMLSLFDTGNLSGFGSRLLVRQSYLGAKAGFWGCGSRFLVSRGFLGAKAEFVGFGLGRLVRQNYLGAKVPLDNE